VAKKKEKMKNPAIFILGFGGGCLLTIFIAVGFPSDGAPSGRCVGDTVAEVASTLFYDVSGVLQLSISGEAKTDDRNLVRCLHYTNGDKICQITPHHLRLLKRRYDPNTADVTLDYTSDLSRALEDLFKELGNCAEWVAHLDEELQ